MERLELDYLRPQSARRYNYYALPKLLIDNPAFDSVDSGAKILYSLMLNRASISAENAADFTDERGRLYIIYTVEEVMKNQRCSKTSAVKWIVQLDKIGLIEKRRRGQGKPTILYVKDFATVEILPEKAPEAVPEAETQDIAPQGDSASNSRSPENGLQEVQNLDFKKSTLQTSRSPDIGPLEVQKMDRNYKDPNYPDLSDPNLTYRPKDGGRVEPDGGDIVNVQAVEESVREQIEYEVLRERYDEERAQEVVHLITDMLCLSLPEITLGRARYPAAAVKRRMRELTCEHVMYALDALDEAQDVRNTRAYLLTALYNAPATMATAVTSQVNRDFRNPHVPRSKPSG